MCRVGDSRYLPYHGKVSPSGSLICGHDQKQMNEEEGGLSQGAWPPAQRSPRQMPHCKIGRALFSSRCIIAYFGLSSWTMALIFWVQLCRSWLRILASCLVLNLSSPFEALAQKAPATVAQPATAQPFNAEQLDALLALIALYPDELLTQTLMASTFPLEVVSAARWVEDSAHKSLSGEALAKAVEKEPWDASVKSLVPFPAVLATMNNNLT